MEAWFEVEKKDVIALVQKKKDCFPWGNHPGETYACLIFRQDGMIWMTVNEFYEAEPETYECCRFYSTILCNTAQEYRHMTEEQFASKAYSAWCSGAR